MRAEAVADPEDFLERAAVVLADEARHNLIRGIVRTLVRSPETYPNSRLYLVTDGSETLAAAAVTLPNRLIVADALVDEAVAPLAAFVAAETDLPGAVGNRPTIDRFIREWQSITGREAILEMTQGVFQVRNVKPIPSPPGSPRVATASDRDLVELWIADFSAEALPNEPRDEERLRKAIAHTLDGEGPGAFWIWENDGEAVSLSGHGNPTGNGIRIGPVYTPVARRGNGYASALVAAESQWLLDGGYRFCFLYADLGNPTSNAIYERIGYRQVAEAASYGFGEAP